MRVKETDQVHAMILEAREAATGALDLLERDRVGAGNVGYLARVRLARVIERLCVAEVALARASKGVPV
jgi:hypothetical protein